MREEVMGAEYYYTQSYLIFLFAVLSGSFIHVLVGRLSVK